MVNGYRHVYHHLRLRFQCDSYKMNDYWFVGKQKQSKLFQIYTLLYMMDLFLKVKLLGFFLLLFD